jgi:hypothetical protein
MTTYARGLIADRRRTILIKRSALLQNNIDDIDRPSTKIAETRDELEQALSLVYQEYQKLGYISEANNSNIHLSIYHILPETAVFIFKSYLTVISTLTQIFDSKLFGLPMDALYHEELEALRNANRRLVEISALATCPESLRRNTFMYLFRSMYWHARFWNANDLCIMVNPKHVEFYKTILLFENLGPEKYYPRVGAPAVALRLNLDDIERNLREKYNGLCPECNLYSFFCNNTDTPMAKGNGKRPPEKRRFMDVDTARYFFVEKTNVFGKAPPEQRKYIRSIYPGLGQKPRKLVIVAAKLNPGALCSER